MDVITWLLAAELLGLLAFPIVFGLTPWLPDRGFTLSKPLGLLAAFYPLWLLASNPIVPNSLVTLLLVLATIAVISVVVVWSRQNAILEFLRREWRAIVLAEAVFLGVFVIWVLIRAYDPAIDHTEQPMDFAFLNSTLVSRHFPPQDPWLAGEHVSYYYYGYLIFGGLSRLAGVSAAVGYNLALALVAAMAATGIFGLGANIVRLAGGSLKGATISGLLAVFLLLGIANLESGLEIGRASGVGSSGFWQWVDIKDLDGPSRSETWYPSEAGWWWWRATRVIDTVENGQSLDYTITEFPFFSFLLGDLHPHVMSLPFVLAFSGLVLNFLVTPTRLGLAWARSNAKEMMALGLVLGALGFINLWDLPVFGVLLAGAAVARGYRQEQTIGRAALVALPSVLPVVALALILYLPFYFTFHSQASGIVPVQQYVTRPFHFLVIWGLFALIITPFLVWELVTTLRLRPRRWQEGLMAAALALLPWLIWSWVDAVVVWDLWQMALAAWRRFFHLLPLMLMMGAVLYVVMRRARQGAPEPVLSEPVSSPEEREEQARFSLPQIATTTATAELAHVFPLLLMALAVLLLMGPELFYLLDLFNNRMNTMFKLYYQAWILLALASSYALYYLGSRYGRSGPLIRLASYGWIGLLLAGAVASVYYPLAAAHNKTSGLAGQPTLDGLAYVANSSAGELKAIRWLNEHYRPGDRIVEAVGDDYSDYGRVSASTGIPTVLGWTFHEEQWRGSRKPFQGRREAVQRLYQTSDPQEAKEILREYGVTYIFIGPRERVSYGTKGLAKFADMGTIVFQEGDVVIYRVRG